MIKLVALLQSFLFSYKCFYCFFFPIWVSYLCDGFSIEQVDQMANIESYVASKIIDDITIVKIG
jgi:hypothetical protein